MSVRSVNELVPMQYRDRDAAEIHRLNEHWIGVTKRILTQLREHDDRQWQVALALYEFYKFAQVMIDITRLTFPNTSLATQLKRIFPLLPRDVRPRVTHQDLTPDELERVIRRVSKRVGLSEVQKKKKRSRVR